MLQGLRGRGTCCCCCCCCCRYSWARGLGSITWLLLAGHPVKWRRRCCLHRLRYLSASVILYWSRLLGWRGCLCSSSLDISSNRSGLAGKLGNAIGREPAADFDPCCTGFGTGQQVLDSFRALPSLRSSYSIAPGSLFCRGRRFRAFCPLSHEEKCVQNGSNGSSLFLTVPPPFLTVPPLFLTVPPLFLTVPICTFLGQLNYNPVFLGFSLEQALEPEPSQKQLENDSKAPTAGKSSLKNAGLPFSKKPLPKLFRMLR